MLPLRTIVKLCSRSRSPFRSWSTELQSSTSSCRPFTSSASRSISACNTHDESANSKRHRIPLAPRSAVAPRQQPSPESAPTRSRRAAGRRRADPRRLGSAKEIPEAKQQALPENAKALQLGRPCSSQQWPFLGTERAVLATRHSFRL